METEHDGGRDDEAVLLAALRAGDERAFERLVDRYGASLVRVARQYVPTHEIASRCMLEILPGQVTPPTALLPEGLNADQHLRQLCQTGLERRYPDHRAKAQAQLDHELTVVSELELSEFFLVVREVTDFARQHDCS